MRWNIRGDAVRRWARWATLPALAAGLAACADLTETSQTFISPDKFYQTDAQAQIAVNAIYQPLMTFSGWVQPAQHSIMCDEDELACESWMGGGRNDALAGNWYMENDGANLWQGNYTMINRANQVLTYVGNSPGVTQTAKNKALGMAYFGRAYAYFDLMRRYGAPIASLNWAGGLPVRTEVYQPEAQLGALPRSTPDSVWNLIVSDLRKAATLLPTGFDASNGSGLPRAASANGLLAKVYLHMAGAEATTTMQAKRSTYLDSATYFAQQVMSDASTGLQPKYMDIFTAGQQNNVKEILFAATGNRGSGSNIPPFLAPAGTCTLVGGCGAAGPGFVKIRWDFAKTFDKTDLRWQPNDGWAATWTSDPSSQSQYKGVVNMVMHNDSFSVLEARGLARRDSVLAYEGWNEGCETNRLWPGFYMVHLKDAQGNWVGDTVAIPHAYYTLKYIDRGNNGDQYGNANNFILLRYADVLLVLAEAQALKTGQTDLAKQALHLIRARAGLPDVANGLSPTAFRDSVRMERRHELYAEFGRRWDMIREGVYLTEMNKDVVTENNGTVHGCRPRDAYQLLHPVPKAELASNPALHQNPGW